MSDITHLLTMQNKRDLEQRQEIKNLSEALFYLIAEIGQHIRTESETRRRTVTLPEWLLDNHPDLVDALEVACDTLGEDPEWWTTHILDGSTDI